MPADEGRAGDDHGLVTELRSRWLALAIAVGGLLTVVLTLIEWPARDYRHGDFFQYWAGAHALLQGADPYDLGWWSSFHAAAGSLAHTGAPQPAGAPAWTTGYPLWTLAAFVPFSVLPFALASAVWLVAQLGAVVLGLAALIRSVLRTARRRDAVVLAGIALAFQPLWLVPGSGNMTGFLFGALAGAVALADRPLAAGSLLGALALKPQSVMVAAIAVLAGAAPVARRRMTLGAVVVAGMLVALAFALRPGWIDGWLRSTLALQGSSGSNATLWTLGRAAGVPALSLVAPLALVAALLLWARLRRPGAPLLVGAAVPVSIAVAPHGWTYDQLHLLITVAVILEGASRMRGMARTFSLAALAVVAGAVPWLLYLVAIRRHTEDWSALVPVLAFALLVAVDRWCFHVLGPADGPRATRIGGSSPT